MDSYGNFLRTLGVKASLPVNGRQFISPDGKALFEGLLEEVDPLDPNMPLGDDLREYSYINVLRPPVEIVSQQEIRAGTDRFKIVKRIDNPAGLMVKFFAVKIVPEDT